MNIKFPKNPKDGQIHKHEDSSQYYYIWNGYAWDTVTYSENIIEKSSQRISREIINETPIGDIDSVNNTFTLKSLPINNSLTVYVNGLLQKGGSVYDYITDSKFIYFNIPPDENSIILCSYYTFDVVSVNNESPKGKIDGINNVFTSIGKIIENSERIYLNGLLQKRGEDFDYIIRENEIIFNFPPIENSIIICFYETLL